MALDISKLKSRLSSLTNQGNKTNLIWKPKPGKQVVRIVPYKYQNDNPFIELKFHYNINNKTYLSPDSFNRPDPIVEWSNRMKKTGNKEDWLLGRKFEPKMRTYAPILAFGLTRIVVSGNDLPESSAVRNSTTMSRPFTKSVISP